MCNVHSFFDSLTKYKLPQTNVISAVSFFYTKVYVTRKNHLSAFPILRFNCRSFLNYCLKSTESIFMIIKAVIDPRLNRKWKWKVVISFTSNMFTINSYCAYIFGVPLKIQLKNAMWHISDWRGDIIFCRSVSIYCKSNTQFTRINYICHE